jgi:hypothetical protein
MYRSGDIPNSSTPERRRSPIRRKVMTNDLTTQELTGIERCLVYQPLIRSIRRRSNHPSLRNPHPPRAIVKRRSPLGRWGLGAHFWMLGTTTYYTNTNYVLRTTVGGWNNVSLPLVLLYQNNAFTHIPAALVLRLTSLSLFYAFLLTLRAFCLCYLFYRILWILRSSLRFCRFCRIYKFCKLCKFCCSFYCFNRFC